MVKSTYRAGRILGKRAGAYIAKQYTKRPRTRNTWKKTPSKSVANNDEVAQADIGYGTHEARRLFTSKGKRRMSRKKKMYRKRSKNFTKKVHKALNTRYPYQKTIINSVQQIGTATPDLQNMYIGTIATSNFGDGSDTKEIRENDLFNIMAQQAATSSYDVRDKQIKWVLENYTWNCSMRNADTDHASVELHQMVCKKSMKREAVESINPNTELVATDPSSLQTWLFLVQPPAELDDGNVFTAPDYTAIGIKPTDLTMIKKYFKTEKIDRYEMQPQSNLTFSRKFHIKKKFKPVEITDHSAIAGVTRLFVFVVRGMPYKASGVLYASQALSDTDGGLIIHQSRVYNWRNDWDSYSRLTTGQQGQQFPTISYCAHGSTLLGGTLSDVTS